ncbi:FERM domain-containing protein 5 [Condylostylus longicornis]|uniref:FERM domain-containing protein 5 n=1 Tax=Condylostylus longicornis TaxID=2530218 RepID=UPI00244DB1B4|nr:FERM domain-containing protein 5 [Condylostylus longicornis]
MFRKNESNVIYKCTVRLLEDDSDILQYEFQPHHKGNYLLDCICNQLAIKEKDYFGLRYVDPLKQRHWLDLGKSILKQVKETDPIIFSFRIKFYPADPFRLNGNGRITLYQQLKRDLRHGRLYCSTGEAAALGVLIVQEEIGDFNPEKHTGDYVAALRLALRQTEALEKKVTSLHQQRQSGQPPSVAMDEFMSIARNLETYGVDPHPVKDHRGTQLYLGINYSGISTFVTGKRSQHFRWSEVSKLNYEGKMFIVHLSYTDSTREPKKHTIGFKCPTGSSCRYVWRCAIEQMLFFTLPNSQNASVVSGGGFFSWGTKFKYTGRTEREILTESINNLREQKLLNSATPTKRASSVPATPSSPQGDLAQIRYSSLPRSTMSEPLGTNNVMGCIEHFYPDSHPAQLEPVTEEQRLRASNFESTNNTEFLEYYFRDSFEHSSTESGLTNPYSEGHRGLFQHPTHLLYSKKTGKQGKANALSLINNEDSKFSKKMYESSKKFQLLKVFIPSFIFVAATTFFFVVVIIESELECFAYLRNLPEMINLKYQYYLPIKNYLKKKW